MKVCREEEETGWEPGRTFLFRIKSDLVYVLRGKVLTGKERLKIQDMVWLIEQGVEGGRKRVGVTVWVKSTGGWAGFEQGEGYLIFQD